MWPARPRPSSSWAPGPATRHGSRRGAAPSNGARSRRPRPADHSAGSRDRPRRNLAGRPASTSGLPGGTTVRLFDPRDRHITVQQARRYAMFEILHTVADVLAALLFVVGSILFFSEQTKTAGTVCFLIGSFFFAAKPSIRIIRELWLARLHEVDELGGRAPEVPSTLGWTRVGDPLSADPAPVAVCHTPSRDFVCMFEATAWAP